jgi:hypothetical protein
VGVNEVLYLMRHVAVTNMQLILFKTTCAGLSFAHTECRLEFMRCLEKQCAHFQDEHRFLQP